MATTPPPPSPSSLRIPGAPLHGAGYDTFEPYPTRCSARLANKRAIGSNDSSVSKLRDPRGHANATSSPKKQKKKADHIHSPPGSGLTTTPSHDRQVNRSGVNYGSMTASVNVEASGLNASASSRFSSFPPSMTRRSGSQTLPTPAKTPSKKKVTQDLSSTSRTLFPPAVKRSRKMDSSGTPFRTPFDLNGESGSSSSGVSTGSIEIFTDSRDRVPVAPREGNSLFSSRISQLEDPFTTQTGPDGQPVPQAQTTSRDVTYMFRGKQVTKQLTEDDSDEDDLNDLGLFAGREHLLPDPSVLQGRALRRKDYKPRMLFTQSGSTVPNNSETKDEPESAHKSDHEDEATDEEEDFAMDTLEPLAFELDTSTTPADDPAKIRQLRSAARAASDPKETPCRDEGSSSSKAKQTPFRAWLRKKKGPDDASSAASSPKSATTPAKRDANDEPAGSPAKRTRANAAHASTV